MYLGGEMVDIMEFWACGSMKDSKNCIEGRGAERRGQGWVDSTCRA